MKMRFHFCPCPMKRFIHLTIILCATSLGVRAQSDSLKFITISPTGSIKNIDWLEKNTVGQFGIDLKLQPSKKVNITLGTALFKTIGSSVLTPSNPSAFSSSYDKYGSHSSFVSPTPKTTYNGGFINADVGIPFKLRDSSNISIEPFLGLEGKIWQRTTDYGTEGSPLLVEEKYKFLSPSFGAKLNYSTKSKVKLTLRISGSYPIVSKLKLDEKNLNLPNAELDLKRQLSPAVEIGAKIKKLTIKLRYERINFGSSDSLRGFSTPSSRANVSGVSVSYDF